MLYLVKLEEEVVMHLVIAKCIPIYPFIRPWSPSTYKGRILLSVCATWTTAGKLRRGQSA